MLIRVIIFSQCEMSFGETLFRRYVIFRFFETSSKIIEMKSNIEIGDMYDIESKLEYMTHMI